jgi:CheY-like chemotaxis protein
MKTILIVDDEFGIVDALRELLTEEGYHVITAANGREGLARLAAERPDLVLLDLMMPILGGRETLRVMRTTPELRDIPVVLMSAAPQRTALLDDETARELSGFLSKPFEIRVLFDLLERLLGAAEPPGEDTA